MEIITGEQYRRMVAAEIAFYRRIAPDLSTVPLPSDEEVERYMAAFEARHTAGPGDKPAGHASSRFQIAFSELDDVR